MFPMRACQGNSGPFVRPYKFFWKLGNCSILTTKNMEKCLVKIFESKIKNFLLYQIFLIFFQSQLLHPVLQFLGGHGELLGGGIETPGLMEGLPDDSGLILRQ